MTRDAAANAGCDVDLARDLRMTADRKETKLLVAPGLASALAREVGRHLLPHRFRGPGATILPDGLEYTTTIYFDTADRDLYREALASPVHLKLRAREYYSVHPALTELATDPRAIVRHTPLLWLEIKSKDGGRTQKRRLAIPKRDIARFFETGSASAEMFELARSEFGADAASVLNEVASLCRRYPTPPRPDCVVHYRRSAWQDAVGELRITLDRAVTFFAPPPDLFASDFALVRERLGAPSGVLGASVLEIKAHAHPPRWLESVLEQHRLAPERFSKFLAASRTVHAGHQAAAKRRHDATR